MKQYEYAHRVITETIRPISLPLGLCLIPQEAEWPERVVRPSDTGLESALCQWTNYSRREGAMVGLKTEDIVCAPCLAAFGFKGLPSPDVYSRFVQNAGYANCEDTARMIAGQLSSFDTGRYQGVLAFPLKSAPQRPDAIWIYGSPGQISHMVTGLVHENGQYVLGSVGIGLSCRAGFSDTPRIVVPGRGERVIAGTDESEMFFALPETFLKELIRGLLAIREKGMTTPFAGPMPYAMSPIPAIREMNNGLADP